MIKIENLIIEKSEGKRILNGINATFEDSKLNAIMGPNGTGKSTLLNAIYGKSDGVTKVSGRILFNESERNEKTWNSMISYVEQESFFIKNQTSRDIIQFSINMKNALDGTKRKLEDFYEMLDALSLHKVLDTDENLLSGGERKRVMLAIEIVQRKSILMLDEPVSDLDSHLAIKLLLYLKKIAVESNITVILTIHQPSEHIYNQLDNLLFIYNGITVYNGNITGVSETLESNGIVKPAGWAMAEFLFEVFYNSNIFPEISVLRPSVDAYFEKCQSTALSKAPVLKSYGIDEYVYNFSVNLEQSILILNRSIGISLRNKSFYVSFLLFSTIYFCITYLLLATNDELGGKNEFSILQSVLLIYYIMTYCSFNTFDLANQIKKEIFKGFYTPFTFCISVLLSKMILAFLHFLLILLFLFSIKKVLQFKLLILLFESIVSTHIFKLFVQIIFMTENIVTRVLYHFKHAVFSTFSLFKVLNHFISSFLFEKYPGSEKYISKVLSVILFFSPSYFISRFINVQEMISLKKENNLQMLPCLIAHFKQIFFKELSIENLEKESELSLLYFFFSFANTTILVFILYTIVFTPKIVVKTHQ